MKVYDVVIVGSGPSGLFACEEILKHSPSTSILILEKGPLRSRSEMENPTCGFGGAGAFSDGKLTFEPTIGGTLLDHMSREKFVELADYVDSIYSSYLPGIEGYVVDNRQDPAVESMATKALAKGIKLLPYKVKHFGTDKSYDIIENMRQRFLSAGVKIHTDVEIIDIKRHGEVWYLDTFDRSFRGKKAIISVGRSGSNWLESRMKDLGVEVDHSGVDVGVRVEMPYQTLAKLTDKLYDMKLFYRSKRFDDKIRSFCTSPKGYVSVENYNGLRTVNGHSYMDKKSNNTNFSVLVTQKFTEPFNDPYSYARNIAQLSNLLGDPVIVQRLGDFRQGRRTTESRLRNSRDFIIPTLEEATPGDLSLVLPYRIMHDIVEFLDALDNIAPGAASDHTLLYGVEVKFYSAKPRLNSNFEAKENLYVIGDGSGYTRGLMQASMMGVLVGRTVSSNLDCESCFSKKDM